MAGLLSACEPAQEPVVEEAPKTLAEQFPDREYVGENNYITKTVSTKIVYLDNKDRSQIQEFPKYHIYRAKEWPREDLSEASSYDLPRVQFSWGNVGLRDPKHTPYEGKEKIWSMKTDGTDLRLVTDEFDGYIRGKMVRSPNNRYLAYGYSSSEGTTKAVFDLETQQTYVLGTRMGIPRFVWAEDSSYLYFSEKRSDVRKWDVATKTLTDVDFFVSDTEIMVQGKRFSVRDFGVLIFDEKTNERLEAIDWGENLSLVEAKAEVRSISPTGRDAWVGSAKYVFHVDTKMKKVTRYSRFAMPDIIGLNSHFGAEKNMTTFSVKDYKADKAWDWRPLGTSRASGHSSLYNSFANNGLWFKEAK